MRFRVKRILRGGEEMQGGSRVKAKNKARGVINSSRLGAYLDGLSEHKEPSSVFKSHTILLFFFDISRIGKESSFPILWYDTSCPVGS